MFLRSPDDRPSWIGEIKWSDRVNKNYGDETKALATLVKNHKTIETAFLTTKTISKVGTLEGKPFKLWPSSLYCYIVGRNITAGLERAGQ